MTKQTKPTEQNCTECKHYLFTKPNCYGCVMAVCSCKLCQERIDNKEQKEEGLISSSNNTVSKPSPAIQSDCIRCSLGDECVCKKDISIIRDSIPLKAVEEMVEKLKGRINLFPTDYPKGIPKDNILISRLLLFRWLDEAFKDLKGAVKK